MRGYFFGNMYLSSIQQGIQAKHCGDEMVVKYAPRLDADGGWISPDIERYRQLLDYLTDHKTVICLSAGYSETIHTIFAGFEDTNNPYPYAKFHEGADALDGALTCAGIIVPDAIYDTAQEVRQCRGTYGRQKVDEFNQYGEWTAENGMAVYTFTKWQVWLINEMNNYPLAR